MSHVSRVSHSLLGRWWWSIDRTSLAILSLIVTIGAVLIMAAGPTAAARFPHIQNEFHFPMRQFFFLAPATALLIGASFLPPLYARRFGVIMFAGSIGLMVIALFGADINGSRRWIDVGPIGLQPSEFAKPGFVIAAAWMMGGGRARSAVSRRGDCVGALRNIGCAPARAAGFWAMGIGDGGVGGHVFHRRLELAMDFIARKRRHGRADGRVLSFRPRSEPD